MTTQEIDHVDLENELNLFYAVVTITRREAKSQNPSTRLEAVEWLNAMRLPVDGCLNRIRISTKKGKQRKRYTQQATNV